MKIKRQIAPAFAVKALPGAGRASLDSRVRILSGQPRILGIPDRLPSRQKGRNSRGINARGSVSETLRRRNLVAFRRVPAPVSSRDFPMSGIFHSVPTETSSTLAETGSFQPPRIGIFSLPTLCWLLARSRAAGL
jgi:hypothetical protein